MGGRVKGKLGVGSGRISREASHFQLPTSNNYLTHKLPELTFSPIFTSTNQNLCLLAEGRSIKYKRNDQESFKESEQESCLF